MGKMVTNRVKIKNNLEDALFVGAFFNYKKTECGRRSLKLITIIEK